MNAPTVGMWMYSNCGGDAIQDEIVKQLYNKGINTLTDLDLAKGVAEKGRIICDGVDMTALDLFFSYNAGQQSPYQTYLYSALSKSVQTLNNYDSFVLSEDKFLTSHLLNQAGIRTADYRLFNRSQLHEIKQTITEWNGEVVYKPTDGWGGSGLAKIKDAATIDVVNELLPEGALDHFYLEKFVNYDKTDYRVDIVDGQFMGCYGRKAPKDCWKTNVSSGGSVMLRDADDDLIQLALDAARITNLEIAGVDLIYDLDAQEYVVLEVNGIPAFATPEQERFGLNFNSKKIATIVNLIERTVNENYNEKPQRTA